MFAKESWQRLALFAGTTLGNIWQDTVYGTRIPRELRGRVASLDWAATTAAGPGSVLLAALVTETVGLREVYVGAGLLAAVASVAGLLLTRAVEAAQPEPAADVEQAAA